jgi:hypothetical protein
MIRIGVGPEPADEIISALAFSLDVAKANLEEICAKSPSSQSALLVSNLG